MSRINNQFTTGSTEYDGGSTKEKLQMKTKALNEQMKSHFQAKVNKLDEEDSKIWEMMTNVPQVTKGIAILSLFLNFLIPGVGTILAACQTTSNYVSKAQITIAFVQFITAIFLVGWILAIYWSYLIIVKAFNMDNEENKALIGGEKRTLKKVNQN